MGIDPHPFMANDRVCKYEFVFQEQIAKSYEK